ncbi:hypothetical protein K458DRAFT_394995 [Lentithecium fluviatile CBS 122367]|uniref:Uncharacterized protein n=1 Tax=Lentithecium fluviatile CBS 122367 TaxID=1168545 RepID=A0A6G1IJN4_9PLEO|nr:hypothetical protein K458DRAFT_394995 [Lentithecium fluviatile CBS 122367]
MSKPYYYGKDDDLACRHPSKRQLGDEVLINVDVIQLLTAPPVIRDTRTPPPPDATAPSAACNATHTTIAVEPHTPESEPQAAPDETFAEHAYEEDTSPGADKDFAANPQERIRFLLEKVEYWQQCYAKVAEEKMLERNTEMAEEIAEMQHASVLNFQFNIDKTNSAKEKDKIIEELKEERESEGPKDEELEEVKKERDNMKKWVENMKKASG